MMKKLINISFMMLCVLQINAQIFKDFGKTIEDKAKQKAKEKIDRHIDKSLSKADQKTDEAIENTKDKVKGKSSSAEKVNKSSNKKFNSASDYVAGTKIIASENFAQDAVGDFPVNWFTNSSGEVNTISNSNDKCLFFSDEGSFTIKNFNKTLPKNFTFEFDLNVTEKFSFYSTDFNVVFAQVNNLKKDFANWGEYKNGQNGVVVSLHPTDASGDKGRSEFNCFENGESTSKNQKSQPFFTQSKNTIRVQFWRQNQRLRMYIDGNKIWDLPNTFEDVNYNAIVFYIGSYWRDHIDDRYFISNIVLAEAGGDTRHKLIESGSFSSNEILFNTNKATMIPSEKSGKILFDLAAALKENPEVKIIIIGHTDSDGNDSDNLKLSLNRANTIKDFLSREYGISSSRMKTEGKGETQPVADNNTSDGKAQNRRVEFKKI